MTKSRGIGKGNYVRPSLAERFWKKVDLTGGPDACWLWTGGTFSTGYGACSVEHVPTGAHRVSWQLHFGDIPEGMEVCHRCDNRLCVNPSHLFLGTTQDNAADRTAKGRSAAGERHAQAKLTKAHVDAIRRALNGGTPRRAIAVQYGVTAATIGHIARRDTWRVAP